MYSDDLFRLSAEEARLVSLYRYSCPKNQEHIMEYAVAAQRHSEAEAPRNVIPIYRQIA